MRLAIIVFASILATLGCYIAGADEESRAVQLLRPDSLIGWNDGPTAPQGWTISDGTVSGTADCSPLLAGWTFADFELRCDWSVAPGGSIQVSFPAAPPLKDRIADPYITPEFRVTLAEGE